jgi:hypothetical protein
MKLTAGGTSKLSKSLKYYKKNLSVKKSRLLSLISAIDVQIINQKSHKAKSLMHL